MAGPRRNRIHAAGVVGRNRRARTWRSRARAGIRRRSGRRLLRRSLCQRGDADVALPPDQWRGRRTVRPVDAGNTNLGPDLLPRQLLRGAWAAVARRPAADGAGGGAGQRRPGGHRMRHRAAVVRPVRDGRSPGVDRRGIAADDHRAGQRPRRRILCLGGEQHGRRDPRARNGVPDPQRAGGQRRQRRHAGSLRRARFVRPQPARWISAAGPSIPDAASAAATAAAGAAAGRAHRAVPGREPDPADRRRPLSQNGCRSTGFGWWT